MMISLPHGRRSAPARTALANRAATVREHLASQIAPSTTAGLMLRESLTEGCGRYALIQVEATGKLVFRWRDKVGPDESRAKELGQVTLPIHLKLTRAGQQVQVFTSTDGQHWGEPLMTHTTTFDGQSRLGLFTCSGNTFASSTAQFESVTVDQ